MMVMILYRQYRPRINEMIFQRRTVSVTDISVNQQSCRLPVSGQL